MSVRMSCQFVGIIVFILQFVLLPLKITSCKIHCQTMFHCPKTKSNYDNLFLYETDYVLDYYYPHINAYYSVQWCVVLYLHVLNIIHLNVINNSDSGSVIIPYKVVNIII